MKIPMKFSNILNMRTFYEIFIYLDYENSDEIFKYS